MSFLTLVLPTFGLQRPHVLIANHQTHVPIAHQLNLLPQNLRRSSHQALLCRSLMVQERSKAIPPKTLSPSVASPSLSKSSWLFLKLHLAYWIAFSLVSWVLASIPFLPSMPPRFGKLSIMPTSSRSPCSLFTLNATSMMPVWTLPPAVLSLSVEQTRVCTRVPLST